MSTTFQFASHYNRITPSRQLETNLTAWVAWSFLALGAFQNVQRSTLTAHGSRSPARLRYCNDPGYTTGTVWEGLRTDWVWESGVPYSSGQPIAISGVWVNSQFVAVGTTGSQAYRINYPEGRILFDSPQPTGSVLEVEHSPRLVQVHRGSTPWFREVAFRSFRADDPQWETPAGSGGSWDILSMNRVQLPAVVIEVLPQTRHIPWEIGNSTSAVRQTVFFHVLASNPHDQMRLHDLLVDQKDNTVPTFDCNQVIWPLDRYGSPSASSLTYPQLCQQAPWKSLRLAEMASVDHGEIGRHLYWCSVEALVDRTP